MASELLRIARVALRRVPVRVLILTASVGEGHDRPALWLAEQLRSEQPGRGGARRGLAARDGPGRRDAQRRRAARLLLPPALVLGLRLLGGHRARCRPRRSRSACSTRFGAPGLLALIERSRADVVVSVYPQASEVLARLRRSGRLDVPFLSGITDVAAMDYWACRGADAYLVTQPEAIDEVRKVAGADADVHTVTGFTDPLFYAPRSQADARRVLGLDQDETIVLVSGGGWGVGDIAGAVVESLGIARRARRVPDREKRRAACSARAAVRRRAARAASRGSPR